MERIALTIWGERISPLFDVSRRLMVVDVEGGEAGVNEEDLLFGHSIAGKVSRLSDLHIQTLICGAISKELSRLVTSHGIRVIAFVAGDKKEVLSAYLQGEDLPRRFRMPGCGLMTGRQRQSRRSARRRHGPPGAMHHSKGVGNGKDRF